MGCQTSKLTGEVKVPFVAWQRYGVERRAFLFQKGSGYIMQFPQSALVVAGFGVMGIKFCRN
jgi:hypothetical protein